MFIYWTKVNILITYFLTVVTEDIAPNVYCNKQSLTWDEAKQSCLNANGKFIAYVTGLGVTVANIGLTNEADVWTADYASESSDSERSKKLCGFCNMDRGKCSLEVMYGDCETPRYFVCRNSSTNGLEAFLGRRDSVSCPDISIRWWESLYLPSGFYWKSNIVYVITDITWPSLSWNHRAWCGAYKNSIGKYFSNCKTTRISLCNTDATTSSYKNSFDKSCFEKPPQSSSPTAASQTTQSKHVELHTVQSTGMQTKTSLETVTTPIGTTATRTTGVMARMTMSIHPATDASWEDGRSDKRNVGVTVGLPVGLGIVLICGIILGIYIIRRYKLKTDNGSPGLKVFWNSTYSTKEESSRFNKSTKSSSDRIVDKGEGESEKIPGDSLRNKDSEYAVVQKKYPFHIKQDPKERSLSKKKHGNLNNPDFDKNHSNHYAKVENNGYANGFAESDAMRTSAYSFAKEIAGDQVDNKGKTDSVIEDEYDVTYNIPNHRSPDNIYNTLQSEDYGRVSALKTDDTTYNVLSAPRSMAADSIYDSTNQNNHSGSTDDTYNHMTEPDMYGSSSISIGRKLQHRENTDQTYDKLN